MSELMIINPRPIYEDIYDRYGAPLFGITLKISKNKEQAEEILTESFRIFFQKKLFPQDHDQIFRHLLRLMIHIAAEKRNKPKQMIGKLIIKELNQAKQSSITA